MVIARIYCFFGFQQLKDNVANFSVIEVRSLTLFCIKTVRKSDAKLSTAQIRAMLDCTLTRYRMNVKRVCLYILL